MRTFTKTDQEAVILNAIWEMIDGMVNYEVFCKFNVQDTNLLFSTSTHGRLFNILLGDFLSQPQQKGRSALPFDLPAPPSRTRPSNLTFLFYLRRICDDPTLGCSTDEMRQSLDAFADWLDDKALVSDVWFSSIQRKLDIRVERISYLKICGDIAKHNFSRLENNVGKVCRLFAANGHRIDENEGFLVLPEFYDWFHSNIFIYHSSTIAEFLNNIRWAIFEYLLPELSRSLVRLDVGLYRYEYPRDCKNTLARGMYWDLMNRTNSRPYFPRFTVTSLLKIRY